MYQLPLSNIFFPQLCAIADDTVSPLYVCCFGLLSEYITKSLPPPQVADCFEHYRPKKIA